MILALLIVCRIMYSSNKRQSKVAREGYEKIRSLESNFGLTHEERSRWGRVTLSCGVSIGVFPRGCLFPRIFKIRASLSGRMINAGDDNSASTKRQACCKSQGWGITRGWVVTLKNSCFLSLTPVIVYFIIFSSQKELLSD